MLKDVKVDKKINGELVTIPAKVDETTIEQQVKRFIEIADYSPFDAHMHLSQFRHFHGKKWTIELLRLILQELQVPAISLEISHARRHLELFFESELEKHNKLTDADYHYPPSDVSRLPI